MADDARVYAQLGMPGSGKSLDLVSRVIIPHLRLGRNVVTNIPLNVSYLFQIHGLPTDSITKLRVIPDINNEEGQLYQPISELYIPSEDNAINTLKNTTVVHDEIQTSFGFDDRRSSPHMRRFREFLSHHRHYGTDIYWASQDISLVDITLRRLTGLAYVFQNLKHKKRFSLTKNYGFYRRRMFMVAEGFIETKDVLEDVTLPIDPKIFACYTSFSGSGVAAKIPMPLYLRYSLYVLGAIALALPLILWRMYVSYSPMLVKKDPVSHSKPSFKQTDSQKDLPQTISKSSEIDSWICFDNSCDFYRSGEYVGSGTYSSILFNSDSIKPFIVQPTRPYTLDKWDSSSVLEGAGNEVPSKLPDGN